ncbi:MAG: hypothetical protein CMN78_01930 [Spirochaetales bacterium]|nr:hypothetical protein [Spirochaetales bacterium]
MHSKIKAGVNTTKSQFDYVFNPAAQGGLQVYLDFEFDTISPSAEKSAIISSVEGAEMIVSTWGALPYTTALSLMKPGARLINTSRGRMINEHDLVEKLQQGEITAYLDVTHPEPPDDGHPFYSLPNCIITPHVAGSIGTEVERTGDYCVREMENWILKGPLENEIDIRALERRA